MVNLRNGLDIGIVVSLCGLASYLVKLTADYTRLKTKFEKAEEEIKRLRESDEKTELRYSAKFTELYDSRNATVNTLTELTTTVKMLVSSVSTQYTDMKEHLAKLEGKIDAIKKE